MSEHPNDPNKGMDVKRYLLMVAGALAVLLAGVLLIVSHLSQNTSLRRVDNPKPTTAASPQ